MLVATFFNSLLKLAPVEDGKDVYKHCDLFDKVNTSVRNLKGLGIISESFGPTDTCYLNEIAREYSSSNHQGSEG